jgi:haloacetate dehalogenase
VLDIVPTWAMWHHMDARLANRAWHWMFLARPAPFPETMVGKDTRSISSIGVPRWRAKRRRPPRHCSNSFTGA